MIGVNDTVGWKNQDVTSHSVMTDSEEDPLFYNATKIQCENIDYLNCHRIHNNNFLVPGGTFEFTFTIPGIFDYYMSPHPHMRGTVNCQEKWPF